MKTPLYAIPFLFLLFWFAGCASLATPGNTLEGLKVSAEFAHSLALSVNEARNNGSLSPEKHSEALDALQEVHDGLQLANDAYADGNVSEAVTRLDQVEFYLRAVALILARGGQ